MNTTLRSRNSAIKKIAVKHLIPDPLNWHTHGADQRTALSAIFTEVGFVGFILVRKAPQRGKYFIIDGHERVETIRQEYGENEIVDCSILDIDEDEARKILATHDTIGSMGGIDSEKLDELLAGIDFSSESLDALLESIQANGIEADLDSNLKDDSTEADADEEEESESKGSVASGFVNMTFPLTTLQEMKIRKILKVAKAKLKVESSGAALFGIVEEWALLQGGESGSAA